MYRIFFQNKQLGVTIDLDLLQYSVKEIKVIRPLIENDFRWIENSQNCRLRKHGDDTTYIPWRSEFNNGSFELRRLANDAFLMPRAILGRNGRASLEDYLTLSTANRFVPCPKVILDARICRRDAGDIEHIGSVGNYEVIKRSLDNTIVAVNDRCSGLFNITGYYLDSLLDVYYIYQENSFSSLLNFYENVGLVSSVRRISDYIISCSYADKKIVGVGSNKENSLKDMIYGLFKSSVEDDSVKFVKQLDDNHPQIEANFFGDLTHYNDTEYKADFYTLGLIHKLGSYSVNMIPVVNNVPMNPESKSTKAYEVSSNEGFFFKQFKKRPITDKFPKKRLHPLYAKCGSLSLFRE